MKWVNRLYIIFLGIILSITTGFGVAAFYPQPLNPYSGTYTPKNLIPESCYRTPEERATPACQEGFRLQEKLAKKDEEAFRIYNNENASYTRTAIFFGIVIGALFAIAGIYSLKKSKIVANGLMFGAVLTAILTRLLINLASLGANTTGTNTPDRLAYVEFIILMILSIAIIFVGLTRLNDEKTK